MGRDEGADGAGAEDVGLPQDEEAATDEAGAQVGAQPSGEAGAAAADEASDTRATGERIQVHLRLRPLSASERENSKSVLHSVSDTSATFRPEPKRGGAVVRAGVEETYAFDHVHTEDVGQEALFERSAKSLLRELFGGESALLFAFGITNAGKTHSIQGTPQDPGVLPRALQYIFSQIQERNSEAQDAGSECTLALALSHMEIYNDVVTDLLADFASTSLVVGRARAKAGKGRGKRARAGKGSGLVLQDDGAGAVRVKGLTELCAGSLGEAQSMLQHSGAARRVARTGVNCDSSRSHSIVTLTLREEDGAANTVRHVAEFLLVDLAGSERIGPPLPTLPTHTARAFR